MSPDDRRRAILDAVIPLIVETGEAPSTKQIAVAAGIAEGTIFRVYPDKASLMMAVAAEAISPREGEAAFDAMLAEVPDLRGRVERAAVSLTDQMHRAMKVMFAVRRQLVPESGETRNPKGPPQFILRANRELLTMLTRLFEPYRDQLTMPPETAAVVLRSLVFGSRHPGMQIAADLTPEQIADVIIDGVVKKETP